MISESGTMPDYCSDEEYGRVGGPSAETQRGACWLPQGPRIFQAGKAIDGYVDRWTAMTTMLQRVRSTKSIAAAQMRLRRHTETRRRARGVPCEAAGFATSIARACCADCGSSHRPRSAAVAGATARCSHTHFYGTALRTRFRSCARAYGRKRGRVGEGGERAGLYGREECGF